MVGDDTTSSRQRHWMVVVKLCGSGRTTVVGVRGGEKKVLRKIRENK
jgi:hypothetical protein